jgi:hypothetical protein
MPTEDDKGTAPSPLPSKPAVQPAAPVQPPQSDWIRALKFAVVITSTLLGATGTVLGIVAFLKDVDYGHQQRIETTRLEFARKAATGDRKYAIRYDAVKGYQDQLGQVRRQLLDTEEKINKIDSKDLQKDPHSGVLVSGNTLKLTREIMQELESINGELFRLPAELAGPVNTARAELFHRHSEKVFSGSYGKNTDFKTNPFYLRDFDKSTQDALMRFLESSSEQ